MDRNKQVIEFLLQCDEIKNSAIYFNFINVDDGNTQILTNATDVSTNRPFVDGSVMRRYTFTLVQFKSVNDIAIPQNPDKSHENIDDMYSMQILLDWVNEQDDLHNYPDFGDKCIIEKVWTDTDEPSFDGIDDSVSPAMAAYSITINIDYIDYTKVIWS